MTREQIENAAVETVQNHFQCNGEYPCEGRDYCEFCNGHNTAFDSDMDCTADDFNEGFLAGAKHVLDHLCSIPWDEAIRQLAEYAEEKDSERKEAEK